MILLSSLPLPIKLYLMCFIKVNSATSNAATVTRHCRVKNVPVLLSACLDVAYSVLFVKSYLCHALLFLYQKLHVPLDRYVFTEVLLPLNCLLLSLYCPKFYSCL